MEQQLIVEILDIMYGRPSDFELGKHRIVIGIWDAGDDGEPYSVYATIEDMYHPALSVYGESSYGSYTVTEALIALRDELSRPR